MTYSKEQLEGYIKQMEQRLTESASAWMKSEVRRGIALAKVELAKLDANNKKIAQIHYNGRIEQ